MTFQETYMWPFLWPQELLIESNFEFIFFYMTSDTYGGSFELLYQLCCYHFTDCRLIYFRCYLTFFYSEKPKGFDSRMVLLSN